MKQIFTALVATFLFITFVSPAQSESLSEKDKIFKLLDAVEKSNLTFIRNGSEYSSKKARSHLEYKYNYVTKGFWFWQKGEDVTVRNFIDKLASESSTTKKKYYIKTKEGTKVPARDWLNIKLKIIESSQ